MNLKLAACSGLWVLAVLGCSSRTPLDEGIRGKLGDEGVSNLQCYVSGDIVLRRVMRSEEGGVTTGHALRVDKGKKIEEVLIAADTPGVIIKAEPNKFYVSFESPIGGKEMLILFQIGPDGRYFMYPTKMDGMNMIVEYGDKPYVATPESRIAHLEIDKDIITKTSRDTRQVPGRMISDASQK
jgi:hypothetical protein